MAALFTLLSSTNMPIPFILDDTRVRSGGHFPFIKLGLFKLNNIRVYLANERLYALNKGDMVIWR